MLRLIRYQLIYLVESIDIFAIAYFADDFALGQGWEFNFLVFYCCTEVNARKNVCSSWANCFGASLLTHTMISAEYSISKLSRLKEGSSSKTIFLLVGIYLEASYSCSKSSSLMEEISSSLCSDLSESTILVKIKHKHGSQCDELRTWLFRKAYSCLLRLILDVMISRHWSNLHSKVVSMFLLSY